MAPVTAEGELEEQQDAMCDPPFKGEDESKQPGADDEAIICEECEPITIANNPIMPSQAGVEEHRITH